MSWPDFERTVFIFSTFSGFVCFPAGGPASELEGPQAAKPAASARPAARRAAAPERREADRGGGAGVSRIVVTLSVMLAGTLRFREWIGPETVDRFVSAG